MDDRVNASFRWCRQLCRRSGSSFCWTFVLLPKNQCAAMYALYAYARIADDLSDGRDTIANKRKKLTAWLAMTEALKSETDVFVPNADFDVGSQLWPALKHTLESYQIPTYLLTDIVRGVMMDLDHITPRDWQELDRYCYHVASAVGLACTRIWQADEAMPEQFASDCGIAFQLTNILRDVANDAQMGRIYLPASELERFGVDAARWLTGTPNGDWQRLIHAVGERAEVLYASGWNTIKYLPPASRRLFSLMWRYYHALLLEVLQSVDKLWRTPRMHIPKLVRARLAAQHFITPLYWSLPNPVHSNFG